MANGKILFTSNILALRKVRSVLKNSCTMKNSQVILSETNQKLLQEAIKKMEEADLILQQIK